MKLITLLVLLITVACNTNTNNSTTEEDKKKILALHENYRQYWLENDSAKVVNLFSEEAAIIPPNNKGDFVRGKKAIGAWWFTNNGDTTYPITGFTYDYDSLVSVENNFAVLNGSSTVKWDTRAKGVTVTSAISSSNYMSVFKKENGEWKYFRQIWNTKPK